MHLDIPAISIAQRSNKLIAPLKYHQNHVYSLCYSMPKYLLELRRRKFKHIYFWDVVPNRRFFFTEINVKWEIDSRIEMREFNSRSKAFCSSRTVPKLNIYLKSSTSEFQKENHKNEQNKNIFKHIAQTQMSYKLEIFSNFFPFYWKISKIAIDLWNIFTEHFPWSAENNIFSAETNFSRMDEISSNQIYYKIHSTNSLTTQ